MVKKEPYKDWIVRYYGSHDDIPPGHTDGELTELIRCKNCKRYREYTYLGTQKVYVCERDRRKRIFDMNADDFCSRGERKEE